MAVTQPLPVDYGIIDAIVDGHYYDPHSVLGPHLHDGVVTVRVLRPFALSVVVITEDGTRHPLKHEHRGVWTAVLDYERVPDYRIEVRYSGEPVPGDDPYRFMPVLGEYDLHLLHQGQHQQLDEVLGAHVKTYPSVLGDVTDPEVEHRPVADVVIPPVDHSGSAKLGARVRPGWFAQTHVRPDLQGRTLLEILHRGDEHRQGLAREQAARVLDRYELAYAGEQRFETLSGGQQARFQILLLELSGATLLLLDEPTDNLDIASAEALEQGLDGFEGTVLAVTHDRWFTRGFDRFLLVGRDGSVRETSEPVWEGRG